MKKIAIYCKDKSKEEKECVIILDINYNPNYTFSVFLDENKQKYSKIFCIFDNPIGKEKILSYNFVRSPKYGELIETKYIKTKDIPKCLFEEARKIFK